MSDNLKSLLEKSSDLVVTLNYNSPHDVATALEVAKVGIDAGLAVSIVDLSHFTSRGRVQPFEMSLRRYIWKSRLSPMNKLIEECAQLKIDFIQIPSFVSKDHQEEAKKLAGLLPNSLNELEKWDLFKGHLGPSLTSHLVTLISMNEELNPTKYRKFLEEQICHFLHIRDFLMSLLEKKTNPIISIFNGRLPSMAAGVAAGENVNSRILWHEIGKTRDYYFLEDFSPHDRLRMQDAMSEFSAEFTELQLSEIWKVFTEKRKVDLATNKFLSFQKVDTSGLSKVIPKSALILTSSPDETVGIGKSWLGVEWKNQYEALEFAYLRLKELGFVVTVRLHPNITTKSWTEYFRGIRAFRAYSQNVILPTDYINTYDLIDSSSIVVVWRSTTGLEANASGKPTFCLGLTRYDLTADVVALHTKNSLSNCSFDTWKVDPNRAMPGILWSTFAARRRSSDGYKKFIAECQDYLEYEERKLRLLYLLIPFSFLSKLLNGPRLPMKLLFLSAGHDIASKIVRRLHRFGQVPSSVKDTKEKGNHTWL
jgi:hypothetical protein